VGFCAQWGLDLKLFDASDPDDLERALGTESARLVWIETPCNPSWDVIDIEAAARLARAAGALLAVDSTAATPVLTRPLSLGADLVMHSATKYLNGHSDAVAGALVTARRDDLWERISHERVEGGAVPGSLEAYLLQRGMRTLFLRVRKSCASAMEIAHKFSEHPRIQRVLYPGLSSHPGHGIALRQMQGGFGGMMTLEIRGGGQDALEVIRRCRLFTPATSFGGVESLIEHRHSVEGPESPVPANWIRVSVGIEAVDDLVADLEQALA
jgi:cystathionine gamma-synthase